MVFTAPCKVNLGLNVTKKREDGYHEISTVMLTVENFHDLVEITFRDDENVVFSSSGIEIDCLPEQNLCVKAYNEFRKHYTVGGVNIHLHKVVPFGAGLGSGSSDATAILRGLNTMFECNASEQQIMDMAAVLGSDTVFFVNNKPKLCEGRGEILTNIDLDLKGYFIEIIKPELNISTKFAYSGITPKIPNYDLVETLQADISTWKDKVTNDFENHTFTAYPELKNIKESLYKLGADFVLMSGSGSTIYSISRNKLKINLLKLPTSCYIYSKIL